VLLIGLPAGPLARAGTLPRAVGIEARQVAMTRPRPGQSTVAVRLTDARYADVFTVVAEDITRHLTQAADGAAAVGALLTRLRKWQQFLEKHPPEGLSAFACQGLFGELRFIQLLVRAGVGLHAVANAWVGPQAANQDFQFSGAAVEVKTSTVKMHQMIEIASERQLDARGVGALFLYFLSLDERRGGGETLPGAVAAVRSAFATDVLALEVLEARFVEAGYLDTHASRYAEVGYTVRDACHFRVAGDFPRIVENELRAGVGSVRYSISVAECLHYGVPEADVVAAALGGGR
jgi:hypothetical protein